MSAWDPYARLGLVGNPFVLESSVGVEDRRWVGLDPAPPSGQGRRLVQVVGPKGAGKTSLLLRWRERAPGPYHHVPPDLGRWWWLPLAPLAYWDEADRIPRPLLALALRAAARHAATVVAGTHTDLGPLAASQGLSVEVIELPPITPERLLAWSERRIQLALRPNAKAGLRLDPETASRIASASGGSWRSVADALHVWAATVARHANDRFDSFL